jgi:multisubunit Na+/H+ antiporter MnhG subunit
VLLFFPLDLSLSAGNYVMGFGIPGVILAVAGFVMVCAFNGGKLGLFHSCLLAVCCFVLTPLSFSLCGQVVLLSRAQSSSSLLLSPVLFFR